jgi:hypothetical protein
MNSFRDSHLLDLRNKNFHKFAVCPLRRLPIIVYFLSRYSLKAQRIRQSLGVRSTGGPQFTLHSLRKLGQLLCLLDG